MAEITQEQLQAEMTKLSELRGRTENLAEAMLEHITKFDERVDSIMTQFEKRLDQAIDERVDVRVAEILANQPTEATQDPRHDAATL